MTSRFHRRGWVIGLAAFGLIACGDKTPNYPGGPLGIPARIELSRGSFELPMGGSSEFAVQIRDSSRNLLAGAVTATSCNPAVATVTGGTAPDGFNALFTVDAVAPGTTCIAVSGAGLSDSGTISVGPARLVMIGPDTASSGINQPYVFRAWALDLNGDSLAMEFPLAWSVSDATLYTGAMVGAALNRHPGDSVGFRSPGKVGLVRVMVRTIGGASAARRVTVGPSPFTGGTTVLSNVLSRPGIDTVLVTRPAGDVVVYDANTVALVDGIPTFITSPAGSLGVTPQATPNQTQNVVVLGIRLPPTTQTGTVNVVIGGLGGADIFRAGTITVGANATNTADASDPLNNAPLTVPASNTFASATAVTTTNFYFTLVGGDCVAGVGGAGSDCTDWFVYSNTSAAARRLTIETSWFTANDIDVTAFQTDGTTPADTLGSARVNGLGNQTAAEAYVITVPGNTIRRFRVRMHKANGVPFTFGRLRFLTVAG